MTKSIGALFASEAFQKAMDEAAAAGAAWRKRLTAATGFRVASLGDWLPIVARANVPHVPATKVAEARTEDLLDYGANEELVNDFTRTALERAPAGHMLRFDCCSCAEVKWRLGSGQPGFHPDMVASFCVPDMRAFDMICEHPGEMMQAWSRPWVDALVVADYPVEYRVYVERGEIIGVSNYYIQRPLPLESRFLEWAARAVKYTEWLLSEVPRPICCPHIEDTLGVALPSFTADYLVTPKGAVLWLEGGPPHTPRWGAHPCCFPVGETRGVALAAAAEESVEEVAL